MPQFIPEHTPDVDYFTRGYLEAVEWLLPEETNRDKVRGFSRKAVQEARADCGAFVQANKADLELYRGLRGLDILDGLSSAGHDFYLSRCGHGAGFFDRGDDPVFKRLQDAARVWGEVDHEVYRGWIVQL